MPCISFGNESLNHMVYPLEDFHEPKACPPSPVTAIILPNEPLSQETEGLMAYFETGLEEA
jgi:hypothetical protein